MARDEFGEALADQPLLRGGLALAGLAATRALPGVRRHPNSHSLLFRLYGRALNRYVDRRIEKAVWNDHRAELSGQSTGLWAAYDSEIARAVASYRSGRPLQLLGARILVVKSSKPRERGVIVVDYSYVFALLAGLFDLQAIAERYHVVLEPSWRGVATPEILLYSRLDVPVFVETVEPRDQAFLAGGPWSLRSVPIGANFWVDPRQAASPTEVRDIDVIMVASWSSVKRHWRVFRALAELRRRGHRLKVALVGYRTDKTLDDIREEAAYMGVADQITLYEGLKQHEVGALLARSKVHVLWSRQECSNRAVIEAMLADVPVLVRQGLTYGYRYPYVNPLTGRFVAEHDLPDAILDTIARRSEFSPRSWVLENMTPAHATAILEQAIQREATALGEEWSDGLVVRTASLHTQAYWNPSDREQFRNDYQYLGACARSQVAPPPW